MAHNTVDPEPIDIHHNGRMHCITFRPRSWSLVGANDLGNLRQWMLHDGVVVAPSAMRTKGNVHKAVAASMDGQWIVSADSTTHEIVIWRAETLEIAKKVPGHEGYIYAVDVSSDSKRVVSGSEDRTVQIFDLVSGVRVVPPLQHDAAVSCVKYSPDGERIATATHRYASVYDARSGGKLFHILNQVPRWPATPLAWSSNGQQLFIASPGKITSFDTSTSIRSEWPIHNREFNVSIVSCGQFIACSAGSSVSLWDYISREQIGTIVNHAAPVHCISISYDGNYLACGRDDRITIYVLRNLLPDIYFRIPHIVRVPLMQISDTTLESWPSSLEDTESTLSKEIAQDPNPCYYTLAARSLTRTHLGELEAAIEDADRSLHNKQSPIGQIARSLALVSVDAQEAALDGFDFVFRDCDPSDNLLLLVIKSILVFICGKHEQAITRLRGLIPSTDETARGHYMQVLGNMYLKQGDYENAVQTLQCTKNPTTPQDFNRLLTISLIFNWTFMDLKTIAWQRLCEALYASGRIKEVGDALLKMVGPLPEDEKEFAHGRMLKEIVTRSGEVTLLAWTGKPSARNSCLPSSPVAYGQDSFVAPHLKHDELERRTNELRAILPLVDALVIYGHLTRLQPVRFVHFRLLLPCIVFSVTKLEKGQGNVYRAESAGLGDVEFTTADSLPLKEPQRLVFVDTRIHGLDQPHGAATEWLNRPALDTESKAPIIEEAPSATTDTYTRALELIVRLGQPFSALLLLRQLDGTYKRVGADYEIVVGGIGNDVLREICVEVLEIL